VVQVRVAIKRPESAVNVNIVAQNHIRSRNRHRSLIAMKSAPRSASIGRERSNLPTLARSQLASAEDAITQSICHQFKRNVRSSFVKMFFGAKYFLNTLTSRVIERGFLCVVTMCRSVLDEHRDDAGGHEVGHGSGEHGAQA
jgi:hypothetical protein